MANIGNPPRDEGVIRSRRAGVGRVLGGFLVENVSWRAAFLINVPLAIAVLLIVAKHVPESPDPDARKLDIPGATLGLSGVVFGLITSAEAGFTDPVVLQRRNALSFRAMLPRAGSTSYTLGA